MAAGTLALFLDTNSFLQLRDLKDLPWGRLASNVTEVDLLVAPIIISELDGHKSGTSRRRRDRSRLALRLIEEASKAPNSTHILREDPVRVRLVLSNAPRFDWAAHDMLDPAKADDQLIAEAMSAASTAIIFSYDAGPRIRARALGMRAISPPDEWLLPPEQTDDQKKISQLEKQLSQALSIRPSIIIKIGGAATESAIVCISPILSSLSAAAVHELTAGYLQQHPRVQMNFTQNRMLLGLGALSEAQVKDYNSKFDKFEEEVRKFFERLHEQVRMVGMTVNVPYELRNESGTSAQGLRIECSVTECACLLAERDDSPYYESISLPKPPKRPEAFSSLSSPFVSDFPTRGHLRDDRDPVAFYWFERPNVSSRHSALQCGEFRPKRTFNDDIYLLPERCCPVHVRLSLEISATKPTGTGSYVVRHHYQRRIRGVAVENSSANSS